jgi:ATP-dependent DNA ligase
VREFRNTSRTGAVRVWRIAVHGNEVHTQFGQLDGKMQEVVELGERKNVGRANEMTAAEDAVLLAERMVLKKTRKGYVEAGEETEDVDVSIISAETLPTNLCFYKPFNSVTPTMQEKIEQSKVWLLRKYDGEMMVIRKTLEGRCEMYSRRMLPHHHLEPDIPWTTRFPQIVRDIETSDIPNGTILLGEIIGACNEDDRWNVAKVMKSKTPKALQHQKDTSFLRYVIWDVAWMGGHQLLGTTKTSIRLDWAEEFAAGHWRPHLACPEIFIEGEYPATLAEIMELAQSRNWEGFVVIDPSETYGDRGFNLRGKAERPRDACAKIKPVFEDDFIALWDPDNGIGAYGRGKYTGKLGSVELYQINHLGETVKICDMGNGWSKKFIEDNSTTDSWPKVVQVKYESRTYKSRGDKTDALQFPRFVMEREDKAENECINPEL